MTQNKQCFILEKEWEADDIIDYCNNNNIECKEMSQDEIYNMNNIFKNNYTLFCHTDIIQKNLNKYNSVHILSDFIPDTYHVDFKEFYKRNIDKTEFSNLDKNIITYPYFVKSVGNDKSIDGTVVKNMDDLLWLCIVNKVNLQSKQMVYITEVVDFICEYRLLIGGNKIYGIGYQRGKKMTIPQDFIKELIQISKGRFFCIDCGYITSKSEWAVIEINPPYSLDQFDIPLNDYISFCVDAQKHILSKILL